MKLALLGVGQAGGKLVDALLEYDRRTGSNVVRGAIAVNTASADLQGLSNVPPGSRLLVGQSRVKGHGVGADNDLGAEVAHAAVDEITGALDGIPVHEVDAFLVVAALGGGTGSGAGPVIARHLKRLYAEPVYALGVLPSDDEGGIYTRNAARSLQTFVREADHLLLLDNEAWRETGESVEGGYEAINEELARRLGVLFGAGEVDAAGDVAQNVVDSSEVINTLAGGGVASLGYASEAVPVEGRGLVSRLRESEEGLAADPAATNRVMGLIRKATLGRLTLPCELGSVERALVVVSGPPEFLDRKGIERGRSWVEEETGSLEVRGGDYPLTGEEKLAAVVLLAGATDVPRIERLKAVAVEAQEAMERTERDRAASQDAMLDEGVDPLF